MFSSGCVDLEWSHSWKCSLFVLVGVHFRDAEGTFWLVNECVTAFVEPLVKLLLNRNKLKNL